MTLLRINNFKVNQIYFEVYGPNNQLITKRNEFYQDKIFKIKLNNTFERIKKNFW